MENHPGKGGGSCLQSDAPSTSQYFESHTNHPSLAMLNITKLYIQIVFMNSVIAMNIRILAGINLIFYYKTKK
jgi:hypothetical protein